MIYSSKQFSTDAGISLDLGKRILEALYDKELNAQDLNAAIWRLREWIMKQPKMADLLDETDDEAIEKIIDEMLAERAKWNCPHPVCCAETPEAFTAALKSADEKIKKMHAKARSWFFTGLDFKEKKLKAGDVVTIQIMRTGTWKHPMYGEVVVDKQVIEDVVTNFKERKRGIDLAVDENHEENHKALGWFREVYAEDDGKSCFAKIELTSKGAELLNEGAYKYFSPEIVFAAEDAETQEPQRNLLIGGAFTNRPFFKAMKPVMMSEGATHGASVKDPSAGQFLFVSLHERMQNFLELLARFKDASKVSMTEVESLRKAYSEVSADLHNQGFDEEVEGVAKKAEGEEPAAPAAPAEGGEGEGGEGGEGEGTEGGAEAGAVQATENDDGSFTVSASEMEVIRKERMAKRFGEVLKKIQPFRFSDKNKKGFIMPKDAQSFAEFVSTFSEENQKKLLGFIGKFKSIGQEVGADGGDKGKVNSDGTVQLTESDPMVQKYMSEFAQNKEQAIASAKTFYELQNRKK